MILNYRRFTQALAGIPCILALAAAGFAADTPFTYHETSILGTSLDLHVTALTQADADKAHAAVLAEIERLRNLLSTYDANTDLGKLNATRDPVKVAPEVIAVLKLYDHWQTQSSGAFSGKLGGIIALWKQAAATSTLPDKAALAAEVARAQNPLWKIDDTAGTVQRLSDQPINIDSLGKGFILDKAAAAGKATGVRGLLLNIGGDITALGTASRTGIEEWTVGIADPAHPADNAAPLVTLKLAGMSVATSGSYARGTAVGDTQLSHILDPRDGYPVDSPDAPTGKHDPLVLSATVIARDNAAANALAATLMVLSPEQSLDLIRQTSGTEALLIFSNGTQLRSSGFSRYETTSAQIAGKGWPNGAQVSLTLQQNTNLRERPYMAIWVENSKGEHVVTLTEWGNNARWANSLSTWARAVKNDANLLRAVSRATRPAGKYSFTWDGKDQAGKTVPAGIYKINVEFAYEHSGHSAASTTITCGDQPATATIAKTQHFDDIPVTFALKGN